MRVNGDGTFVLEITDFEVQSFDLAVEQYGSSVTESDLFFLEGLSLVVVCKDNLGVPFLFWVYLLCTVRFDELLDTCIP